MHSTSPTKNMHGGQRYNTVSIDEQDDVYALKRSTSTYCRSDPQKQRKRGLLSWGSRTIIVALFVLVIIAVFRPDEHSVSVAPSNNAAQFGSEQLFADFGDDGGDDIFRDGSLNINAVGIPVNQEGQQEAKNAKNFSDEKDALEEDADFKASPEVAPAKETSVAREVESPEVFVTSENTEEGQTETAEQDAEASIQKAKEEEQSLEAAEEEVAKEQMLKGTADAGDKTPEVSEAIDGTASESTATTAEKAPTATTDEEAAAPAEAEAEAPVDGDTAQPEEGAAADVDASEVAAEDESPRQQASEAVSENTAPAVETDTLDELVKDDAAVTPKAEATTEAEVEAEAEIAKGAEVTADEKALNKKRFSKRFVRKAKRDHL